MSRYARVENGVVVEILDLSGDPAKIFPSTFMLKSAESPIDRGYLFANGVFSAPPPPAGLTWSDLQAMARVALDASDVTVLRCVENAVVVPPAWATYRAALRAIVGAVSGDPTTSLPARPAYPPGT